MWLTDYIRYTSACVRGLQHLANTASQSSQVLGVTSLAAQTRQTSSFNFPVQLTCSSRFSLPSPDCNTLIKFEFNPFNLPPFGHASTPNCWTCFFSQKKLGEIRPAKHTLKKEEENGTSRSHTYTPKRRAMSKKEVHSALCTLEDAGKSAFPSLSLLFRAKTSFFIATCNCNLAFLALGTSFKLGTWSRNVFFFFAVSTFLGTKFKVREQP